MTRIGLAVMLVLLLAAGRSAAEAFPCAGLGEPCAISLDCCAPLVCDFCRGLVWLGGGEGGAADCLTWLGGAEGGAAALSGVCVQPTATPTSTATPTATTTPTTTPTPQNLRDGDPCSASVQCASKLCSGGVCATPNPAPAVSNRTAFGIGAALLLAGLWSMRRVARRR